MTTATDLTPILSWRICLFLDLVTWVLMKDSGTSLTVLFRSGTIPGMRSEHIPTKQESLVTYAYGKRTTISHPYHFLIRRDSLIHHSSHVRTLAGRKDTASNFNEDKQNDVLITEKENSQGCVIGKAMDLNGEKTFCGTHSRHLVIQLPWNLL